MGIEMVSIKTTVLSSRITFRTNQNYLTIYLHYELVGFRHVLHSADIRNEYN
jgi:hypothetical protein